jgi:hypothetical protein
LKIKQLLDIIITLLSFILTLVDVTVLFEKRRVNIEKSTIYLDGWGVCCLG